jgi:phytoene synthase
MPHRNDEETLSSRLPRMTPEEYCQAKAAQSGSSFYYSFLFLPPERRRAITALYAFCREVDDVVDEVSDAEVARAKLAWWRQEIANLFAGRPQHPVTHALAPVIARFPLPQARFEEVIAGMLMDLQQNRYLDFAALQQYCHYVAGVVGMMAAEIFGYTDPCTLDYARELGLAFQLTNIIRDVGEDARRGRIYLPLDELREHQVTPAQILLGQTGSAFRALMRAQTARARDHYARAYAALPPADRKAQRPGLVMAAIYRKLLDEIETADFAVLHQRIALTPVRKLWIAWRTWISA